MLRGTGGTTTPTDDDDDDDNNNNTIPSSTRVTTTTTTTSRRDILRAFDRTQQEWWETDTLLERVVTSIVELQRRWNLVVSSVARRRRREETARDDERVPSVDGTGPAQHGGCHCYLTDDDLDLTVQHVWRRREGAWRNLRWLLAQLRRHQDALGRCHEDVLTMMQTTTTTTTTATAQRQQHCTAVYQTAALDLYQKQMWGRELLHSSSTASSSSSLDEVVEEDRRSESKDAVLQRSETIAARWSRSHPASPWQRIRSRQQQRQQRLVEQEKKT